MRSSRIGNSGYPAVEQRQPELGRERLADVALCAQPERDEQRSEPLAAVLLQSQRALDAGGVELSAGDQDFAQAHSLGCIHSVRRTKVNR